MRNRIRKNKDLYSKSNFLIGVGSVWAIDGNYYDFNYSKTGQEADVKAFKSDWNKIGQDFRKSIKSSRSLLAEAKSKLKY